MDQHKITNTPMPSPIWFWHCDQFAWVSVPKNANMMMRKICLGMRVNRKRFANQASNETVCILRNPRTRLISALGEFRKRKRRSETLDELLDLLLKDPSGFDEHLEPQCFYVHNIAFSHILKFENLDAELMRVDWIRQHSEVVQRHLVPNLLKESRNHTTSIATLLEQHHGIVENIIDRYYARDAELWTNHINYQHQTL